MVWFGTSSIFPHHSSSIIPNLQSPIRPSIHPSIHSSILYELLKPWALGGIGTPDHMYLYLHIHTHTEYIQYMILWCFRPTSFLNALMNACSEDFEASEEKEDQARNQVATDRSSPLLLRVLKLQTTSQLHWGDKHCKGTCFPKRNVPSIFRNMTFTCCCLGACNQD